MSTCFIRFLDELKHYKSFLFLKNQRNRGQSSEKPSRWSAYLKLSIPEFVNLLPVADTNMTFLFKNNTDSE